MIRHAIAIAAALCAANAGAASFTIAANSTTARTLAANETGTVNAGAALTVGGSAVAVNVTGSRVTLNNAGTIAQTGTGRAVRANVAVTEFVVNNGSSGLMRTADADVIQVSAAASSVTLNNYGALLSLNASAGGAQAVDFAAVTGANTVNNYAGGVLTAYEADAVRPGANGVVTNAGTIRSYAATGGGSDGIDGQQNAGIAIANTGLVDGGRHGIPAEQARAGAAFTLDVVNGVGGIVRGNAGSGINIDGVDGAQLLTVVNHGTIVGNGVTGDGDGIDVDGLLHLTNTGTIRSLNAFSAPSAGLAYSEGITAGGGTIVNSGTIEGLVAAGNRNAVGRGITLAGNDIASGPLAGTREGLYGNAQILNHAVGLIRGQGDSAIVVEGAKSGYTVTIDNRAGGVLRGGGLSTAAVRTGADDTTLINAGTIDGASSGKAVQFGAGNDTFVIVGGSAVVTGDVDGGAGVNTFTVDAGAGQAFAYGGALTNFRVVELKSGTFAMTGSVGADTGLVLAGGTLDLRGAGDVSFANFALADSSAIVLGAGALTFGGLGPVTAGETLVVTGDGTLRFVGNYVDDAAFRLLMGATRIDSLAVAYSFDGTYTNVSAVPEPAAWAMMLAAFVLGTGSALWRGICPGRFPRPLSARRHGSPGWQRGQAPALRAGASPQTVSVLP